MTGKFKMYVRTGGLDHNYKMKEGWSEKKIFRYMKCINMYVRGGGPTINYKMRKGGPRM